MTTQKLTWDDSSVDWDIFQFPTGDYGVERVERKVVGHSLSRDGAMWLLKQILDGQFEVREPRRPRS
jgi:hypothetical protein